MRSLWTAASGMTAQQLNVDTISNNIANVNTTGYKQERLEFRSLLYQTMERASLDDSDDGKPVNLQVGHGVRPIASSRSFVNGSMERTENPLDFYLQGDGFFVIETDDDTIRYTKDGSFKLSIVDDTSYLVTSEGYSVLNVDGDPISFDSDIKISQISVNAEGNLTYIDEDGEVQEMDMQFDIVQFPNVQGLEAIGNNLYKTTSASGEAIQESEGDINETSKIIPKYLEMSNVNIANEMIKLIIAQRAYELNSKAVTTSDDMLQQANNLKR